MSYRQRFLVLALIITGLALAGQAGARAPTVKACDEHHPTECRKAVAYWRHEASQAKRAVRWQRRQVAAARLVARVAPANHLTPLEVGRALTTRRGWTGRQWVCLVVLWSRESGWVPTKSNYAGSGAYGIPQSLPGRKMASAGPDWRTNAATQIIWGLGYIDARYGSPCGALAYSNRNGSY